MVQTQAENRLFLWRDFANGSPEIDEVGLWNYDIYRRASANGRLVIDQIRLQNCRIFGRSLENVRPHRDDATPSGPDFFLSFFRRTPD